VTSAGCATAAPLRIARAAAPAKPLIQVRTDLSTARRVRAFQGSGLPPELDAAPLVSGRPPL
jgi:hypothetical protein